MRKIKLGAIALALALATALPVEVPYTAGLIGAPPANALAWDYIKAGAKKVGKATKRAAKKAGGAVYRTVDRGLGAIQDAINKRYVPKPAIGHPLPKPPNGGPGSWGGNAGRSAIARPVGAARSNTQPMRPSMARVHRR
jgi:hypothetical protein